MELNTLLKNSDDMIYLVKYALHSKTPNRARIDKMNLQELFQVCQTHYLTACAAYALEAAGVRDEAFSQAKEKAIRKNILLDSERRSILSSLEEAEIWYMPLKGVFLKEWYPRLGMRQMSDNDILYDVKYREKVRKIMTDRGFTAKYGLESDDDYYKEPVYNFEMHHTLFRPSYNEKIFEYFDNVKKRLIPDEDSHFGYHFSLEDFYIYLVAHEYKHYTTGGTGVRSLVDIFVFVRKFHDILDWEYLKNEFTKLGMLEYEKSSRSLAIKLFTGKELTEKQKNMLNYYVTSGAYGNVNNKVKHNIDRYGKGSKGLYIFHRIFPPMDYIKYHWNFFYRHKWLIPLLWIYRPFHGLKFNGKKIISEIKALKKV